MVGPEGPQFVQPGQLGRRPGDVAGPCDMDVGQVVAAQALVREGRGSMEHGAGTRVEQRREQPLLEGQRGPAGTEDPPPLPVPAPTADRPPPVVGRAVDLR